MFLSEPITAFLITLWIFLLLSHLKEKSNGVFQVVVSGLIVLCHPYFIFLPISVWFMLFLSKQLSLKRAVMYSISFVIIISIWPLRNVLVLNAESFVLTTSSGAVMAKGWNSDVVEMHTNTQGDLANEGLVLKTYPFEQETSGEVGLSKHHVNAVLYFIKTNPDQIAPIIFTKLKSAFNPFAETEKGGVLESGRVLFHLLSLIAFIILLFSESSYIKSILLGLIFATIGITIVAYSGFRFRSPQFPIELLAIIYAAHSICKCYVPKYVLQNAP